jgi:hypothetical protein
MRGPAPRRVRSELAASTLRVSAPDDPFLRSDPVRLAATLPAFRVGELLPGRDPVIGRLLGPSCADQAGDLRCARGAGASAAALSGGGDLRVVKFLSDAAHLFFPQLWESAPASG